MAKLIKNNFGNFFVILVIFSLVTGWWLSGWPQIWEKPPIPPKIQNAQAAGTGIFVVEKSGGTTYYSSDGVTWSGRTTLPLASAVDVTRDANNCLFALLSTGEVYKSCNSGGSWTLMGDAGTETFDSITSHLTLADYIYVLVTATGVVKRSIDGGANWITSGAPTADTFVGVAIGRTSAADTTPRLYIVDNDGTSYYNSVTFAASAAWTAMADPDVGAANDYTDLASDKNGYLYVLDDDSPIVKCTNPSAVDPAWAALTNQPPTSATLHARVEQDYDLFGTNPSNLYTLQTGGLVHRSLDGGATAWTSQGDVGADTDYVGLSSSLVPPTTTLGDGTDPGLNPTVAPGTANNYLDQFTFVTNTATDSVSALTVTTVNTDAIASMQIWNEAMTTQYFSTVSSPTGDTWSFSGGTAVPASTSATSYRVIFTAKSHAVLTPGTYAVTGTVTAFTSDKGNNKVLSDTDSDTVTVDNSPPADATWGTITPGDSQIALNWSNPGADFYRELILRKTGSAVGDVPTDGTEYAVDYTFPGGSIVRYVNNGTTFTDTGLTNGTSYYYKIFAYDTYINYASGSDTGPHVPQVAAEVTCTTPAGTTNFADNLNDANIRTSTPNATTTVTCTGCTSGFTMKVYDTGGGASKPGLYCSGCSGTADERTIGSASAAYADTATLSNSVEGYGIQATTTSASININPRFLKTGTDVGGLEVGSGNAVIVASSTGSVSSQVVTLIFKAAVALTNQQGSYQDTITIDCVVN